ncbi:MAG: hypothetical protein KIS92_03320 [Planctomycetota bacterium]|nr:hypothetical protein [Planctomycetota bacterium]
MAGRDDPFVRADGKPPNRLLRALRRHAWWMLLLALAAALLAAREQGLLELERCTFTPKSLIHIPSRTAEAVAWKEGEAFAPHPYALEIDAGGDEGLREGLRGALKDLNGLEPQGYGGALKLEVVKAEYTGRYWMPYKKEGQAAVQVRVSGTLETKKKRLAYAAEYQATIAFTVEGPCSVRGLKRKLGSVLGTAVNEDVSAHLLRGE